MVDLKNVSDAALGAEMKRRAKIREQKHQQERIAAAKLDPLFSDSIGPVDTTWLGENGYKDFTPIHYSGYMPDHNQVAFTLCIRKDTDLDYVKSQAEKLLPMMKYEPMFHVFEHTLSEYGSYFVVREKDTWLLKKSTFGTHSIKFSGLSMNS